MSERLYRIKMPSTCLHQASPTLYHPMVLYEYQLCDHTLAIQKKNVRMMKLKTSRACLLRIVGSRSDCLIKLLDVLMDLQVACRVYFLISQSHQDSSNSNCASSMSQPFSLLKNLISHYLHYPKLYQKLKVS